MTDLQPFLDEVSTLISERPEDDRIILNLGNPGVMANLEMRIGSRLFNGEKPFIMEVPESVKSRLVGSFAVKGIAADEQRGQFYAVLDHNPSYVVPLSRKTANYVIGQAFRQTGEYVGENTEVIEVTNEAATVLGDLKGDLRVFKNDILDIGF